MTEHRLLKTAKEIIANGCGCDRECDKLKGLDVYCGCESDAKEIIALVRRVGSDD